MGKKKRVVPNGTHGGFNERTGANHSLPARLSSVINNLSRHICKFTGR